MTATVISGDINPDEEMLSIIEECQVDRWVCEIKKRVEGESITGPDQEMEEELTEDCDGGPAWDHVNEKELDPKEIRRARGEEIGYMVKRGIWRVRPVQECWDKLGKAPVSVRWVDTLKADGVRSRLVARDFLREAIMIGMIYSRQPRHWKARGCF